MIYCRNKKRNVITLLYLRNILGLMLIFFLTKIIVGKSAKQKSELHVVDNML